MKQYGFIGWLIVLSLFVVSCAHTKNPFPNSDLTREVWMNSLDTQPEKWKRGADNWFLTGDPTATEESNLNAPSSAAVSTMAVNVSGFSTIKTDGDYDVQIFGSDHDSVYVFGPNAAVGNVLVEMHGSTLFLHQKQETSPKMMKRVIIRIGVTHFNRLIQMGCGKIEIIRVHSNHLEIVSRSSGNIYLSGNVNLQCVEQYGAGSINVFGAVTPDLTIKTYGGGSVNIAGKVGIHTIIHHGNTDINIVGANSDGVNIDADGSGKISLYGQVNLQCLSAKDDVCIYINCVSSERIDANISGKAQVGIAGRVRNLNETLSDSALFAGRNLCAQNAYVKTSGWAHSNVNGSGKVFAKAVDNSSIYFYGPGNVLSRFTDNHGRIMVFEERNWCNYGSEYRPYSYTDMHLQRVVAYPYHAETYRPRRQSASNYIK